MTQRAAQPAWSADGTKIAFSSIRNGLSNEDIFVINSDGTGETQLTFSPAGDSFPKWSPDGTRITFFSRRDGDAEIYVMNADGSNPTNLTHQPADDFSPDWSPDGARIVFSSTAVGNWQIYVMGADGSSVTRLTFDPAPDNKPAWSPDGRKIAFHRGPFGSRDIYVMNADGTNPTQLSDQPGDNIQADWQPYGDHIRGSGWIGAGRSRISFTLKVGIALGETRPSGHVHVIDHGTGAHLRSTSIEVYEWSGPRSRHIEGTCEIDGTASLFALDLADNGEPGKNRDVFQLMVAGVTYGPATLNGGNLEIESNCSRVPGDDLEDEHEDEHEG